MRALRRSLSAAWRRPATQRQRRRRLYRILLVLLVPVLLVGYWYLPLRGQVVILSGERQPLGIWPQVWMEPAVARPGEQVSLYIRDNAPWFEPKALVNGANARRDLAYPAGEGPWTWRWHFDAPAQLPYELVFYHSCHAQCTERGRFTVGDREHVRTATPSGRSTKLGVVFPDSARDWHGKAGWGVDLTYTQLANDPGWTVDVLAQRVRQAERLGLRPLVRIAYDRGQSLPPAGDEAALARYLEYCARLARDQRLGGVYAYFVGSGYNTAGENQQAPDRPVTPEWYARVFNGYGTDPARSDNVVQTMKAINPQLRILVGPVTPWKDDQDGALKDRLDLPWLNYMNTVVSYVDSAASARLTAGVPLAGPDGFAAQAPGRPEAPEVLADPGLEPLTDLRRAAWGSAQAGFRVYQDWLAIINRHPTTRGLPLYITSSNTFTADANVPPVQNYPRGWLTNAYAEIRRQPQVLALCWFVDSHRDAWRDFSLSVHPGRLNDAAAELDSLLRE